MNWQIQLAIAATIFIAGWTANGWRLGQDIAEMQAVQAQALAEAQEHVKEVEREQRSKAEEAEKRYLQATQDTQALADANADLARKLGGLRDPYATSKCVSRASTPASSSTASSGNEVAGKSDESEGLLSPEASAFLLRQAKRCDKVIDYAWTCYGWVQSRNPPNPIE